MTFFLSLLPVFLFGNLHCFGMCGPLAALMGKNGGRFFYLGGRILSFSLTGLLAAEAGFLLNASFKAAQIPALAALIFGLAIFLLGNYYLFGWKIPGGNWIAAKLTPLSEKIALLAMRSRIKGAFLLGFFSIFLPCGQTLIVFSACASLGSPLLGLACGFFFALCTSPALLLAMHGTRLLQKKISYNKVMGFLSLIVGLMAILRGLAELAYIPHLVLNKAAPSAFHIVLY